MGQHDPGGERFDPLDEPFVTGGCRHRELELALEVYRRLTFSRASRTVRCGSNLFRDLRNRFHVRPPGIDRPVSSARVEVW